jgi:SAM-dependent methyltransferase
MKTINRLCFCCAGKEGAVYPLGYHFIAGVGEVDMTIRICARCGSVLQDPAPTPEMMNRYYTNYSNYTNVSRGGQPDSSYTGAVKRQINIIKKFLKPGIVFEVGCATGFMLSKLKKDNYIVTGCDPSLTAAAVAKNTYDIDIETGLFDDITIESKSTDLVIFSHVLEHVFDPQLTLKKAWSVLSPLGKILIEVPCLIYPEKWPNGYFTFEHINYFTEESLTSCLSKYGFTPIYTGVYTDNLAYPVILVLAQKSQSKTLSEGIFDSPKKIKNLIDKYLLLDYDQWQRIDQLLNKELEEIDDVVIYGGGVHTSQLLNNTVDLTHRVKCIIDTNPQKHGLDINGIKICGIEALDLNDKNSAIVISSKAYEDEIYDFLINHMKVGSKVIRLYKY